jgi:F0F1-type ATP synthase beta subunit
MIILVLSRHGLQISSDANKKSNYTGEPIDERGPVATDKYAAIHAEAPEFVDMSVEQEILVTGIKVVDLLAPYAKGGKIGKNPQYDFIDIFFNI